MLKRNPADLAALGGKPAFEVPVHVGQPNLGDRERLLARLNDVFDRRWLTNAGPLVAEFEARLAEELGVRHCVVMCNGTVALEIAVRALELRGEVIMPSFTFVATAHALQWQGVTPVFCDLAPGSHNIDPEQVERMVTPRTTGIMGVHVWGRPCEIEALTAVAERRRLALVFDASHAFGCSWRGRPVGNFGRAEVFSFHATKFLNSAEGGAVATNDDALAAKMRLMKNFGFAGYDRVTHIGTNGKMSELSAAVGLTNLESLETFLERLRRNYGDYQRALADMPGLHLLPSTPGEGADGWNHQYVVLEVDRREAGIGRDDLLTVLWAENVRARRYFYPGVHRMEPYRSLYPHAGLLLPRTEALTERVLVLPTGTQVGPNEIDTIASILRVAASHGPEITARLAGGDALP